VVWLGSLPSRLGLWLTLGALVIFAGGMAVEGKLTLQTDPERWVNQSSNVSKKIDTLDKETGSSSELGIFVQSKHPFDDKTVTYVDHFARQQLAERPQDLLTASSIVTTVSFILDIPGASTLAPTGADVSAAYDVAPKDIQRATANLDAGAQNLVFRTASKPLEERAVYVDAMRDQIDPPPGVSATPSGLAVVGVGLLHNLEDNRILLTYLAIAFVAVFLMFRLWSIPRALLSLVPVLIAVGTASLAAWALSLKLSPMTAVGGPLVVAACTEFTSLILLRYLEERRRGLDPREAVDVTAGRTGRAFIVSACTAIAGVAVIAFSSLPLLRDFGIVVALNVAVALLSALVILPPLLVWADRRNWVSHGIVDDSGRISPKEHPETAAQR
jgi:predicted RND superfamily exporter protein